MADSWESLIEGEVVDCSTISISYQPNGLANISYTVFRKVEDGIPFTRGSPEFELCAGGVNFRGWVTQQTISPARDLDKNYRQWTVNAVAIGCKSDACETVC